MSKVIEGSIFTLLLHQKQSPTNECRQAMKAMYHTAMPSIRTRLLPFVFAAAFFSGCSDPLNISPDSELSNEFLATSEGINAILLSAYDNIQYNSFPGANKMYASEWPTDIMWETGGGLNRTAVLFINYSWDPSEGWFEGFWNMSYQAIRDANIVLENVEAADVSAQGKRELEGEARFVRATAYVLLENWFGPTPLVTSSEPEDFEPARATQEEIDSFIESEYGAVVDLLPETRPNEQKGRATKGAALGMLTKYHLNNKQWQKAAQTAQQVIDLGVYELHADYNDLFTVSGENNNEFIWIHNAVAQPGEGNVFAPANFPPGYPTPGTHENWAAQVRLRDSFVNSFAQSDVRKARILTDYTDVSGNQIQLLGEDNARSLKYEPDPNASGRWTGNDIPEVRYADILLSRAEALNELNGPNQESIDLINMIRTRAEVDPISLSDFGSKESLRNHLLKERSWELYHEAKRREDMIRHGVLISNAQARGMAAQPHHVLYPIPQSEINANPNLEQNQGY